MNRGVAGEFGVLRSLGRVMTILRTGRLAAFPRPVRSLAFRNVGRPELFHRACAPTIARQHEAGTATSALCRPRSRGTGLADERPQGSSESARHPPSAPEERRKAKTHWRLCRGLHQVGVLALRRARHTLRQGPLRRQGQRMIMPAMRELRAKLFNICREAYVRDRLIEQHNWYLCPQPRIDARRRAPRIPAAASVSRLW